MNPKIRVLAILAIVVILCAPMMAQTTRATITGTVSDESGASVPGAKVTVTQIDTGYSSVATSDSQGNYVVTSLLPGRYRVEAEHPGFSKTTIEPLDLRVDQRLAVNPVLKVGAVTEAVRVTSQGSLVESASSSIGQVVETQQVVDLPLNGRNFSQLALLSPGTTTEAAGTQGDLGGNGINISISGGRVQSNQFSIDGMYNSQPDFGALNVALSIDAIAEFSIQRNTYTAEFGFGTGQINVASKSGSNGFHGTLYEFLRNDALDARQFIDAGKPPYRQNQYGASFGGPIKKDKTFFFLSYEGFHSTQKITQLGTLPSAQELAGNLAGTPTAINPFTGKPFPSNQIPTGDFSALTQRIIPLLPMPGSSGANNFVNTEALTNDFDQLNFRVDHRFSANDTLFARYTYYPDLNSFVPNIVPKTGQISVQGPHNGNVQYTHVFSPTLLNEVHFGMNRAFGSTLQEGNTGANILQFKNVIDSPINNGLAEIAITGFSPIAGGNDIAIPAVRGTTTYQITDALNWTKGRHNMKFGADFRDIQFPIQEGLFSRGEFAFTGAITGNPLADFLLGIPTISIGAGNIAIAYLSWHSYDFFVQDDWKILPNLTLNFGMRYDRISSLSERYRGVLAQFDPRTGNVVPSNEVRQQGLLNPDNIGFQPRFGFAWQPLKKNDFVVRGGFGVYNDSRPFNERLFSLGSYLSYQLAIAQPWDTLFPAVPATPVGILTTDPFARDPYVEMYSLGVQKSLPWDSVLEVYYVGQVGHKLSTRIDVNQATLPLDPANPSPLSTRRPYPNIGSVLMSKDIANSNYNSLQVRYEKRLSHNLLWTASYTYSKSLDTASSTCDLTNCNSGQNNYDLRAEYGPSSFDQRHRFVFSPIYQLPFGRGQRFLGSASGPLNALVSGWQATTIFTASTGLPYTIQTVGQDREETGTFGGGVQRANCNGQPGMSGPWSPLRAFNVSAFSLAPLGTYGNCGRDNLYTRGNLNFDISFLKDTHITEATTLQFRAEMFNAFNHPQFIYAPIADPTNPAFGQEIAVAPARQIQFALKLLF